MTKFFWHPKTFHCINIKVLENDLRKGGINFPNIEIEIEAYFLETISIAMNHPEKQWVGMLRYRLGEKLKGILKTDQQIVKLTDKPSPTSDTIIWKAFQITIGNIKNWEKADFKI